ncbi:unnamed protein product [Prunus armeniaca]
MALWRDYQNFILASDSQEAVSLVTGSGECWSNLGNLVEDVRNLLVHLQVCEVRLFWLTSAYVNGGDCFGLVDADGE